jgi:hypothetical protein
MCTICVLLLLSMCHPELRGEVEGACYICVLLLLYVSSCYYMCVLILLYVSSYYYICVLVLLCMCHPELRGQVEGAEVASFHRLAANQNLSQRGLVSSIKV